MAVQNVFTVPEDFLAQPAKNISVSRIDFAKTTIPDYKDRYAVILDNVLTLDECNTLINAAEAGSPVGWERAMVNIGGGRQAFLTDQRNCGRIIWDDQKLVSKIWKRIEDVPEVQEIVRLQDRPLVTGRTSVVRGDVWAFSRPNERMRFLKYVGGEYFRPHCDGVYETPDGEERSWFTMHLYLNGDEPPSAGGKHEVLVGGATKFHAPYSFDATEKDVSVEPKIGRVLVFQHRDLLHSGDDVLRGVKYTMRTDLMYALEST